MVNSVAILFLMMLLKKSESAAFCCPTPEGYEYDKSSGLCVILLYSWENNADSRELCHSRGERLVWLDSSDKQGFFKSIISDSFWLGGYKTSSGSWGWSENVSLSHHGWSFGQPDGSGGCICVGDWSMYDWDDAPCSNKMRVACERTLATPTNCPQPVISTNTDFTLTDEGSERPENTFEESSTISQVSTDLIYAMQKSSSVRAQELTKSSPVLETVHLSSSRKPITPELKATLVTGALDFDISEVDSVPVSTSSQSSVNVSPLQTQTHLYDSQVSHVDLTATDTFLTTPVMATFPTSSSVMSSNTTCGCTCTTFSQRDLEKRLDEIKERLQLDYRKLSKTLAKYTSAPDGRRSSISMGSMGIGIMVFLLCLVVMGDLEYVVRFFQTGDN